MIHIGFDPGKNGGWATIPDSGPVAAGIMPVSGNEIDARVLGIMVWDACLRHHSQVIACVEVVHAMPGQGVTSMFTFGKGYGTILGVLGALGVRTELVTPQAWKKVVLAGTDHGKDAAIAWCRRAYPMVNLRRTERCSTDHDGMAEAVAICEYGRRTFR